MENGANEAPLRCSGFEAVAGTFAKVPCTAQQPVHGSQCNYHNARVVAERATPACLDVGKCLFHRSAGWRLWQRRRRWWRRTRGERRLWEPQLSADSCAMLRSMVGLFLSQQLRSFCSAHPLVLLHASKVPTQAPRRPCPAARVEPSQGVRHRGKEENSCKGWV